MSGKDRDVDSDSDGYGEEKFSKIRRRMITELVARAMNVVPADPKSADDPKSEYGKMLDTCMKIAADQGIGLRELREARSRLIHDKKIVSKAKPTSEDLMTLIREMADDLAEMVVEKRTPERMKTKENPTKTDEKEDYKDSVVL